MTMDQTRLEAIKARAAKATKGPWMSDTTMNEGDYGGGEDIGSGFYSYEVISDAGTICDTINSDVATVQVEYDEDRTIAWDEVGKANMGFIAHARQDIPDLIAALEAAQTLALRWQQQATSATPGGSEFCDPDYCGEYLRQNRREMAEAKLERAALRKRIHELGEAVTI